MNGKINKDGALGIERAGKYQLQICHFKFLPEGHKLWECSDYCPLFGEPEDYYEPINDNDLVGKKLGTYLQLCHQRLFFKEFTDERINNGI